MDISYHNISDIVHCTVFLRKDGYVISGYANGNGVVTG